MQARLHEHADRAGLIDWNVPVDATIARAQQHATNITRQGDLSNDKNPLLEPCDQQVNRKRRGAKGGRPPKFDPEKYRGRNVIERGYCQLQQWRGLAARYDKYTIVDRAAVVLNGVIARLNYLTDTP